MNFNLNDSSSESLNTSTDFKQPADDLFILDKTSHQEKNNKTEELK